jgi:alkylation response protein AidB-like acyl-CoA dehydrogenase
MDVSLNKMQISMAKEARRFLEKECSMEYVREMFEDEKGFTDEVWAKMSEMDWMGLRIPEEYGGIGLSFMEMGILFEEMGRVAMPGPFLPTMLAAEAIIDAGTHEQKKTYLEKIAMGEIRATLALFEEDSGNGAAGITLTATAEGENYLLNGTKLFVLGGQVSDLMIVAARTSGGDTPEEGITLFLVDTNAPGISRQPLKTLDAGRRQSEVVFDAARVSAAGVLGEVDRGWGVIRNTLNKGAVALSLESVGGGQRSLEIAVEHAKERVQFDRPIGSFQAIKHKCAQIMLEVEGARSIGYYAALAMEKTGKEAALAASAAKAYAGDMFRNAASQAIQVVGAIGLTEEHEMHIYLKRAKMNEFLFGDPTFHREELARILEY